MPPLFLRRATKDDSTFLFTLRNEETVRHFSLTTDPIDHAVHEKWFAKRLASADSVIFIAEVAGAPIAQVRFDRAGREAEVSIAVVAAFRGKGYGTGIISEATKKCFDVFPDVGRVVAHINMDNAASEKSFTKAGYLSEGETEQNGVKRKQLVFRKQARR